MKCAYNIQGGCRKCETCGAEPHEINEDCDACWCCQGDEGILRWDNSKEPTSQDIKQLLQEMIKEIDKQENETKKEKVTPYIT